MNLLVFTDSRGQHKPVGQSHLIFPELLALNPKLSVKNYLCPMKWTTTLDFLEMFSESDLSKFDHIILYTGIVDWSPRPVSNAYGDLYCNLNVQNISNANLNTRDYSKKVINDKKKIFDEIFTENRMREHFSNPFDVEYSGEKTINMYDLKMARDHLLPKLKSIRNLIYITSNRFVKGWEGDYKKGRPQNIDLTHQYSDLFSEDLKKTAQVIDLREWSDDEVKIHTCDNLHLSKSGSDYIYEKIEKILNLNKSPVMNVTMPRALNMNPMKSPERFAGDKTKSVLQSVNTSPYLATLIIGVRLDTEDITRITNLKFMLSWLEHYYGDLFEILIVEQDAEPKLKLHDLIEDKKNIRYQFIYNPTDYNRGWGYNVAVKHFCPQTKVIVLMDTDVLTSANFVREVLDCHTKYDAVSPYQNIYYTDPGEAEKIKKSFKIDDLNDEKKIKNPVTLAGGILIIKKKVYMAVRGFEQYVGYGCEDRALDVTIFNHLDPKKIRIAPFSYVHMYHPSDNKARSRFKEIYGHLTEKYGCQYYPGLDPYDSIHKNCTHVDKKKTLKLMIERTDSFGDPDLYKKKTGLTINGVLTNTTEKGISRYLENIIFPPNCADVGSYKESEIYKSAPAHDASELSVFYNAFKGKRCFIIGNGPSLNKNDLSLLENEYTFGVNSFYYKTRETGFRPYFYVVEDSSVMKENIEEIREYDVPFKFFPTNYKNLHPEQPNTFFFRMNRGFYEKSSPNYVVPRFSTDASDVLYCGQSVTYINLQLAYYMGFTEVYLIGMDFSYLIPDSHKRTGDVLLSDTDDPNHFHKDYFGKGKTWKDPKLDRVALNYKMAKLVYEATGRKIYNATIGGSLEIFERVDYDQLFSSVAGSAPEAKKMDEKSFSVANTLAREGAYSKALGKYVGLTRSHPGVFLYKRAAMDCYMKAVHSGQACAADDVAYLRGLIVGLP